ncbi:MAG: hypothetical protein IJ209_07310 [Bacteroidaceae bacterium]|nr:hypothetical protein [Bacteroidaceae bacterium]
MKQTDLIPNDDALRQALKRRAERRQTECPPPADLENLVMQRIMQQAESTAATGRKRQRSRVYSLILPALSAAAAVLIGILLWPDTEKPSAVIPGVGSQIAGIAKDETHPSTTTADIELQEQPLVAQQTKQISTPVHQLGSNRISTAREPISVGEGSSRRDETKEDRSRQADSAPTLADRTGNGADPQNNNHEPLEDLIAGLTIVPQSADLGSGVTMRLGEHCSVIEEHASPIPADKQALVDIYIAEAALQVAYQQRAQAEALRAYAASITGEETPKEIIAF